MLISLILLLQMTKVFFLRGYRHSEREKLRQQTRDNAGVNAFGFGSIAIKSLTNHPKLHTGRQKMSIRNFETFFFFCSKMSKIIENPMKIENFGRKKRGKT